MMPLAMLVGACLGTPPAPVEPLLECASRLFIGVGFEVQAAGGVGRVDDLAGSLVNLIF